MTDALTRHDAPDPTAVVLVLHGGKQSSQRRVDGRSASWRRALALQSAIAPEMAADGVSTWVVRNTVAGWNHPAPLSQNVHSSAEISAEECTFPRVPGERCRREPSPLADARAALARVADLAGDVPVVLLGHSMGARTAVHVAGDPRVVGVVGLAPWWPDDESVAALRGRHLVGVHGSRDRITSAGATRAYVERARSVASSAAYVDQGPVGHYMLRRAHAWNAVAARECRRLLQRVPDPA